MFFICSSFAANESGNENGTGVFSCEMVMVMVTVTMSVRHGAGAEEHEELL